MANDYYNDPLPHQVDGQRYSLMRAIRSKLDSPNREIRGLEGEVSREIERRSGRSANGLFVPLDVAYRALDTTAGAGSIAPRTEFENAIGALRKRSLLALLGARMPIVGIGKISYPRFTSGTTASTVNEGSAASGSSPALDQVSFSPRTCTAYLDVTRKMVKSGGPGSEEIIIGDMSTAVAVEIDRVGFVGSGTGSEPTGLANLSGITAVSSGTNGGAPTRQIACNLERTVADANAEVTGASLAFVTTPKGRSTLRMTEKVAGTGRFLVEDDDLLIGKPVAATNQLPSNLSKGTGTNLSAMIYGNFNDAVIPLFGYLDLLIDPFKFSSDGVLRMTVYQDYDFNVRHLESFAKVVDMVTS